MAKNVELKTKAMDVVSERFIEESKRDLITNDFFDFEGAHTVKVYEVTTASMNDYNREDSTNSLNRYGEAEPLNATTKTYELKKDRSFTYVLDRLDVEETEGMDPNETLKRQISEVVIPEVDSYTYKTMSENAGTKAEAETITSENIYDLVLKANEVLDDELVPETERSLIVTPAVYTHLKRNKDFLMATDIAEEIKLKGVVAIVDGLKVIKVPKSRLPENFGFMVCHKSATCTPIKLSDYNIHDNPPGISGYLVEGRIAYDTFVIGNKAKGIYYQPINIG